MTFTIFSYRIYSNKRPGHLFNFWTFRVLRLFEVGAYSRHTFSVNLFTQVREILRGRGGGLFESAWVLNNFLAMKTMTNSKGNYERLKAERMKKLRTDKVLLFLARHNWVSFQRRTKECEINVANLDEACIRFYIR